MDDKILEAFEFGKIQECKNIQLKLKEHNIGWDEFISWIDTKSKRYSSKISVPKRLCPKCKNLMSLFQVNFSKATQVGGGFKSQWQCINCEYDIFSKSTPHEEILKTRRLQNGTR